MCKSIEKSALRKQMLLKRKELKEDFIKKSERKILQLIKEFPFYLDAKTIMIYMDYRNEAPTNQIINDALQRNKNIILPVTDDNFRITPYKLVGKESLITSSLGIIEPNSLICPVANPKEIDLILIPGVVFDYNGNRIGFGKGCYDSFLPNLRPDAVKVGLSYEFQLSKNIPSEITDVPMDFILTEERIYKIIHA
ncbi:5-formyltetrahydrofolate cyclo-ligase [Anaerovorax sp. IOR16]|uniref:5-formyltetrahydrofolate cyclo-ligase n=1 Tax=Anaerovorax sp. IOR16 TaxID=2773458 RepID=UPI0019D06647|nr:5-formyltetrahydrofolate cyclo-ligase [Anaerovorax sp. IOR16]